MHLFGLDSILSLREVSLSLLLLLSHSSGILWRQASSNGSGLLCSEIERQVLLALVEDSQLVSLVGVDDCEGSGDRFSQIVSSNCVSRIFYPNSCACPYILVNLLEPPPAIFWTLREPSSVFKSVSCFLRSSLFLPQRSLVLTRAVFDYDFRSAIGVYTIEGFRTILVYLALCECRDIAVYNVYEKVVDPRLVRAFRIGRAHKCQD